MVEDYEDIEMVEETHDVYDDEYLDEEVEDDEIDPVEEGFMKGYNKESMLRCEVCGAELGEDFITVDIDGTIYRFCSEKCKEKFEEELIW